MAFDRGPNTAHFAKILLIGLNFITFALGVLLLAMSLYIRSDSGLWVYVENLDLGRYFWACYFGMASGGLLFLISFLGCMGTSLDSRLLFGIHSILSVIAIVSEVWLIVLVWKLPGGDRLQYELSRSLDEHINRMEFESNSRNFLDLIQLKLQCCGAGNFVDYKVRNMPVPQSCSNDLTNNINYRSCSEMLRRYLEIRGGILGGLGLMAALMQVLTTSLSLFYCKVNKSTRLSI